MTIQALIAAQQAIITKAETRQTQIRQAFLISFTHALVEAQNKQIEFRNMRDEVSGKIKSIDSDLVVSPKDIEQQWLTVLQTYKQQFRPYDTTQNESTINQLAASIVQLSPSKKNSTFLKIIYNRMNELKDLLELHQLLTAKIESINNALIEARLSYAAQKTIFERQDAKLTEEIENAQRNIEFLQKLEASSSTLKALNQYLRTVSLKSNTDNSNKENNHTHALSF